MARRLHNWKVGDCCRVKSVIGPNGQAPVVSRTVWIIKEFVGSKVRLHLPGKWSFRCDVLRLVPVSAVDALGALA